MTVNRREVGLMIVTAAAALFGLSSLAARSRIAEWRQLRDEQDRLEVAIEQSQRLSGQEEDWSRRLEEVRHVVPAFAANAEMDVHWIGFVERLAARHGLRILRLQAGRERLSGDVYELPIEVTESEGTLEAFVHFLFELEGEGAMIDVRYLRLRPKDDTIRTGRFSLLCAYTRE